MNTDYSRESAVGNLERLQYLLRTGVHEDAHPLLRALRPQLIEVLPQLSYDVLFRSIEAWLTRTTALEASTGITEKNDVSAHDYLRHFGGHGEELVSPQEILGGDGIAVSVFRLPGVCALGPHAALVTPQGVVLRESVVGAPVHSATDPLNDVRLPNGFLVRRIAGPVAPLHGYWSDAFWHWIMEWLPRVILFEQLGLDPTYVVPPDKPFILESLEYCGVPASRILEYRGGGYTGDEIITATPVTGGGLAQTPNLMLEMRQRLLAAAASIPATSGRRIYLARRNPSRPRRVVNHQDVETLVSSFGFSVLDTDNLPLAQQIAQFREAETLIGPHGSGMTHALFMPTSGTVMEFFAPTYVNPCILSICQVLNHHYEMLASLIYDGNYPHGENILVSTAFLTRRLEVLCRKDPFASVREAHVAQISQRVSGR